MIGNGHPNDQSNVQIQNEIIKFRTLGVENGMFPQLNRL